jgi:hypothetical protein
MNNKRNIIMADIKPETEEYDKRLIGEQYTRLINEELSISKHVEYVSNTIFNTIKNDPQTKSIHDVGFIGQAELKHNTINFNNTYDFHHYRGNTTDCSYIRNSFPDSYIKNNKIYGIIFELEYKTLNYKIENDGLLELIFHEVEHAYQDYLKLSKGIYTEKSPKNELYNFAIKNIHSKCLFLSRLCRIIYISNTDEQDAYANQTYSELKQMNNLSKDNLYRCFQQTEGFGMLSDLYAYQKQLPMWNEKNQSYNEMQRILNLYNIKLNNNDIKNLICNTIKRFNGKLKRVLSKVANDRNIVEYAVNHSVSHKLFKEIRNIK